MNSIAEYCWQYHTPGLPELEHVYSHTIDTSLLRKLVRDVFVYEHECGNDILNALKAAGDVPKAFLWDVLLEEKRLLERHAKHDIETVLMPKTVVHNLCGYHSHEGMRLKCKRVADDILDW